MWPFWGEGQATLDDVVRLLVRRGWVQHGQDGRYVDTLRRMADNLAKADLPS
jgi:hypothetical protein